METPVNSHIIAINLLLDGDAEGALRIVGPMLEANPADISAWRITAMATLQIGDKKIALRNLEYVTMAFAESQNPILAIACAKEIESLGGNNTSLISKLSIMYGADSDRLEESSLTPPPLPAFDNVTPWDSKMDTDSLISKVADTMAMAWGTSLAFAEKKQKLPYIPLLSTLDSKNFEKLVATLERISLGKNELIIEQGKVGDAMYVVAEGSVIVNHVSKTGDIQELAQLGPGAFFGEMAIVSNAPRAAEVRALNNTVLLRASKKDLEKVVQQAPKIGEILIAFCHARMLENLMRVSPVLAPVPPEKRPNLIARFSTDYRKAGETIIEQDTEGPGLFLVVSGEVSVLKTINGKDVNIATLGPGDLFGEISLLMRKPSTAKVVANQNTALLILSKQEFSDATSEFPELLKGAYDIAVNREIKNNSILGQTPQDADELILI